MADAELEPLIRRQLRRWAIEQRAGMPAPRGPCVALSRLPGSGGREIAARVAEWLDYGLFDRGTLESLAAHDEFRERLGEGLEAATRSAVAAEVARALAAGVGTDASLQAVFDVIATLGQRGMSVLLGRGAATLLPAQRALRVLVVAPAPVRSARLARERGMEPAAAEALLRSEDAERERFLRESLGVTMDDPTGYDLVINTAQLADDAAAALVVDALRRRFPPS